MHPENEDFDESEGILIPDHADLTALRVFTVKGYTDLIDIQSMCKAMRILPKTLDRLIMFEEHRHKKK